MYQLPAHNRGFSAVATVVIAAAVIIGGVTAVSVSQNNSATTESDRTNDATTTRAQTETDTQADTSTTSSANAAARATTNFACANDQSVSLQLGGDQATLTLPNGDTRVVTRTQVDGETEFVSEDGSLVFRNEADGAVIVESGQTLVSGCVPTGSRATVDRGAEPSTETQATTSAEATTSADTQIKVQTQTEVEGSVQ